MAEPNNHPPGLFSLIRRFAATGIGALQNRAELLVVEWQQERAKLAEVFVWATACMFFGLMALTLFTAIVIYIFPENLRLYAAIGFALVYSGAAVGLGFWLKSLLKRDPFPESIDQARKDRAWVESLK